MTDSWVARVSFLLLGGAGGVFLPQAVLPWVLGILLLIGIRLWLWKPGDFFGHLYRPEIIVWGAALLIGFVYGMTAERGLPEPLVLEETVRGALLEWGRSGESYTGVFRIDEFPDLPHKPELQKLERKKFRLKVYLDEKGDLGKGWEQVRPGDVLSFRARLEQPKPPGIKGGFDLRVYNSVRGLRGSLTARGDPSILVFGKPSLVWQLRHHIDTILALWDSEETGVLEGILFGDSGEIPQEIQERYRVTGVLHVFAASGSNVALVLAFVWFLTRFFPIGIRVAASIAAILFYALLCGGNPPIVRASVMGIAVVIGRLGRGRVSGLRWLFLAGFGMFAANPLILKDAGFLLSFAAAWGIIILTPKLAEWKYFRKIPKSLRLVLAGTLGAQLAALPFLISLFHRLSLAGFFANMVVLYVIASVLELGLAGVVFSFYPSFSVLFFQVSLWLLKAVDFFLKRLAAMPYADVWVVQPGFIFWLIYYSGITLFLLGKKERTVFIFKVWLLKFRMWEKLTGSRRNLIRTGAIVLIFLVFFVSWMQSPRDIQVVLLDVGQGDAILIQTPKKHTFLIDAGPGDEHFDSGERIILPYLLSKGISHLDGLIMTHNHWDHIGGAGALIDSLPVDFIGLPEGISVSDELKLSDKANNIIRFRAGDRIKLDSGAWFDVLAPVTILQGTHSDPNNNSLVLKLNYQGQTFLFTGDMEQEEMAQIKDGGFNWEADYFKEPHHGSRFSLDTEWLDSIQPKAVFISVGRNSFGHPSSAVLNYWRKRGIPVYRTDLDGTIHLYFGERGGELFLEAEH